MRSTIHCNNNNNIHLINNNLNNNNNNTNITKVATTTTTTTQCINNQNSKTMTFKIYNNNSTNMNNNNIYHVYEKIGSGTYGKVYRALNTNNNQIVALKAISVTNQENGVPVEVKYLLKLRESGHVVNLIEYFYTKNDKLILVFEYIKFDLWRVISEPNNRYLPLKYIKHIIYELLVGLNECHSKNIMHLDIKPSNLLIDTEFNIKLADFGLATYFDNPQLSNHVVSLFYRPPELLLGSKSYGSEVDIWSAGCIFAELLTGNYLFAGTNDESQLDLIFKAFGTPNERSWPGLRSLPGFKNYSVKYKKYLVTKIKDFEKIKAYSTKTIDLLSKMLTLNPKKRISVADALQHKWFAEEPKAKIPGKDVIDKVSSSLQKQDQISPLLSNKIIMLNNHRAQQPQSQQQITTTTTTTMNPQININNNNNSTDSATRKRQKISSFNYHQNNGNQNNNNIYLQSPPSSTSTASFSISSSSSSSLLSSPLPNMLLSSPISPPNRFIFHNYSNSNNNLHHHNNNPNQQQQHQNSHNNNNYFYTNGSTLRHSQFPTTTTTTTNHYGLNHQQHQHQQPLQEDFNFSSSHTSPLPPTFTTTTSSTNTTSSNNNRYHQHQLNHQSQYNNNNNNNSSLKNTYLYKRKYQEEDEEELLQDDSQEYYYQEDEDEPYDSDDGDDYSISYQQGNNDHRYRQYGDYNNPIVID